MNDSQAKTIVKSSCVRKPWTVLAAGLLLALLGCASDDELGSEWHSVDAAESNIIFLAANAAASHARFYRFQSPTYTHTVEVGHWTSEQLPYGRAAVWYVRLESNRHYPNELDLKELIEDFKMVEDHTIEYIKTPYGPSGKNLMKPQIFKFTDITCLGFSQHWGETEGRSSPDAGNRLLYGYFCADPGQGFAPEDIGGILKSIGVRS